MNDKDRKAWGQPRGGGGGAVYFFGLIGAMVYYIQQAHGFWSVIVAILKGFVWPAFVIYDLLKFMGS